ncbi:UNVERIFIED_CONTAM: hypothetical protein FKN15_007093 [Acipenser sinensis]
MLRSCGLGETHVSCFPGGDDRNQEEWHREKRYYGTSWSSDSYLDPFAKSYNDRPAVAPLQELDSWKNSIRAELAKELQEQMRELDPSFLCSGIEDLLLCKPVRLCPITTYHRRM